MALSGIDRPSVLMENPMVEFDVRDLRCGHCVGVVTQARVEVDLGGQKVEVESSADRQVLALALADAGYPPAA